MYVCNILLLFFFSYLIHHLNPAWCSHRCRLCRRVHSRHHHICRLICFTWVLWVMCVDWQASTRCFSSLDFHNLNRYNVHRRTIHTYIYIIFKMKSPTHIAKSHEKYYYCYYWAKGGENASFLCSEFGAVKRSFFMYLQASARFGKHEPLAYKFAAELQLAYPASYSSRTK